MKRLNEPGIKWQSHGRHLYCCLLWDGINPEPTVCRVYQYSYFCIVTHVSYPSQLYHKKFEQLLALTSRITSLARTLGAGFFARDILEPKIAGDGDSFDTSSHRDVTPERFALLEKELVRGKGEVVCQRAFHLGSIRH